jgi:hypothetical protein
MPATNKITFEVGSLAIAAVGTAERLTAHRIPQGFYLTLHAHPDNTGKIYFGKTKVIAEAHLFTLEAGASAKVATDNVGDVWADCSVEGEIIEWLHETANIDA